MSACARAGGILVQLEHFTTAPSETFVMTFCEVGGLKVGTTDLSKERDKHTKKNKLKAKEWNCFLYIGFGIGRNDGK